MYEACPSVLKRATAPLKALPILTKNHSKIRENPTHNWVVGSSTLCICGSPPPLGLWTLFIKEMEPVTWLQLCEAQVRKVRGSF